MEIDSEVFKLLRDVHQLIMPNIEHKEKGSMTELDSETALFLENGCLLAQYMLKLHNVRRESYLQENGLFRDLNVIALEGLQHLETPAVKLFNWNTICRELEAPSCNIKVENKSLLVAGDQAFISQLLSQVRAFDPAVIKTPSQTPSSSRKPLGQGGSIKISMGGANGFLKKKEEIDKQIQASKKGKGRKKKLDEPAEGSIDITLIDHNKPLIETDTPLEFMLISIAHAFKINPKQAAALLTNGNLYMQHACIKGLKGEFLPVVQLMTDVFQNCKRLCTHSVNNWPPERGQPSQGKLLLDTYKLGFFSQSESVAEATCKLFVKIYHEFLARDKLEDFTKWFIAKNETAKAGGGGGFEGAMFSFKNQPAIVESFTYLCLQTFKGKFQDFWPMVKADYIKTKATQYIFLADTLPSFYAHSPEETIQELVNPILIQVVKDCQNGSLELKPVAFALICEIWIIEPNLMIENTQVVQQRDEEGDKKKVTETLAEIVLKAMVKASKDKLRNLRLTIVGQMFRLLSHFAAERNSFAPQFYKALTLLLVEHHEDEITREMIMANFKEVITLIPNLPISIILEPLVKCMADQDGNTYHVNVFDFDFLILLCKHPKLEFNPNALQLMDLMAKIYLQHAIWAQTALICLMILATRFLEEQECQDFLGKFCSLSLSTFLSLKKPFELVVKGMDLQLPLADVNMHDSNSIRKIKRFNIVTLVKKVVLEMKLGDEFNEQIKEQVLHTNRRYKQYYGTMCRGLIHLLEIWEPKAKKVAQDYIKRVEEEERVAEQQEAIRQKKLAAEEEKARIQARYYDNSVQQTVDEQKEVSVVQSESLNSQAVVKFQKKKRDVLLVAWIHKGPKNDIERKAWKELEQIRNKRSVKVKAAREKRKQEKEDYSKQQKEVRNEILRRKVELGVDRGEEVPQELIIYETHKDKNGNIIPPKGVSRDVHPRDIKMKILDLENEEEQRDADGVSFVIQKYTKLLKFLFNQYSMTRTKSQKAQNFEFYSGNTINISEIAKLLREHETPISNEILNILIRLLNQKVYKQLNSKAMNFDVFAQLVPQIAFYRYSNLLEQQDNPKPGEASKVTHKVPGEILQQIFDDWRTCTQKKGQSTVIYDDPDILSTAVDDKLLIELNKKLRENQEYLLPEQFFKVYEKVQKFHYMIPQVFNVREEVKIGTEMLDDIINSLFGFHFLEPVAEYINIAKAKPRIKQLAPPVQTYLDYKTRQKQFILAQPLYQSTPNLPKNTLQAGPDLSKLEELKFKKTELGTELKIAAYKLGNGEDMQEVAGFLEEVLNAVSRGEETLRDRKVLGIGGVSNRVLVQREQYARMSSQLEKTRNQNRLDRKTKLTSQLQTMREVRDQGMETPKTLRKRLREEKIQVLQQHKDFREQVLQRKEQLKSHRDKLADELQETHKEQQESMQQQNEERLQKQKEFLKQQKLTLRKDFNKKVKERQDTEKQKQDFEKWQKEKLDKQKKQMEDYFKQNKEQTNLEKEETKQINEFLSEEPVQNVFLNYSKSLEYLFNFYAKQETKKLTRELTKNMDTFSFVEFIKFGYSTGITPGILQTEDMVQIYRIVIRERKEEFDIETRDLQMNVNQMTYEEFKKAMLRICILGSSQLGGKKAEQPLQKSETLNSKLSKRSTSEEQKQPKLRSRQSSMKSARDTNKQGQDVDEYQMLPRKTLERKAQRDLAIQKEKYSRMFGIKIEDKRLSKCFEVSKISHRTLEALLKFCGIQAQSSHNALDQTINKQRIEVQGQAPTRIKKTNVKIEKAEEQDEDDINRAPGEEEGENEQEEAENNKQAIEV